MRNLIIAVQFLTRLTISSRIVADEEELGEAMSYFPLVGMLIGSVLVLVHITGKIFLPLLVVDSLILAVLIALTGAMHLDGFMDTIDGLAGGKNKEEILEIMKDSRVGAIGVASVFCLLVSKLCLIHELPVQLKNSSLILMPVVGRWVMVMAASSSFYARPGTGIGRPFIDCVGLKEFALASIMTAIIAWLILTVKGIILLLAIYPVSLLLIEFLKKKIDGLTGDTLGCISEVIEVTALLFVMLLGWLESSNLVKFL